MKRLWPWLAGYAVLRLVLFPLFPHCAEDAYITFRAARNWIAFGAPTFNFGEPSWPASSPLWTAWVGLGLLLNVAADVWARFGSLVAELFLIAAVARLTTNRTAALFAVLLAGFQCSIAISLSGIEMYAMIATFAWALLGNRTALALLIVSRPEGLVLAPLAWWASQSKRRAWPSFALGFLGWLYFAFLCHSWLPAGVSAKVGTYGLHGFAGTRWLSIFWPFTSALEQRSLGVCGLAALALAWWAKWDRKTLAFVGAGAALVLGYWAVGAVYFFWYMALPICGALLVVASAASKTRLGWIVIALVVAASWTTKYPSERWEHQYILLGRVASALPDTGTVVMDAIGIAGWQKPQVRFVDMIGLSSHEAERIRRSGQRGWLTKMLEDERPAAFVLQAKELLANVTASGSGDPFLEGSSFGHAMRGITESDTGVVVIGYRPRFTGHTVVMMRSDLIPSGKLLTSPANGLRLP